MRGQRSEVRGQGLEVRDQESEVRELAVEDKVQGTVCQVQVAEDKEQDLQHKDQAVEVRAQVLEFPVQAAEGRELELEVKEPAATGLEPAGRGRNLCAGAPMNDGTVNGPALSAGGGNPSGPSSYRGRNWRAGTVGNGTAGNPYRTSAESVGTGIAGGSANNAATTSAQGFRQGNFPQGTSPQNVSAQGTLPQNASAQGTSGGGVASGASSHPERNLKRGKGPARSYGFFRFPGHASEGRRNGRAARGLCGRPTGT